MELGNLIPDVFKSKPPKVEKASEVAFAGDSLILPGMFTDYNPDDLMTRKGYTIYKKMMTDEQVKAVIRFHRDAVTGREWSFEDHPKLSDSENKKRAEVLEGILQKMPGSFKTRLDMIMSSLYNGFSLVEKTFQSVEIDSVTWVGIKSLRLKPFETFHFLKDKFGGLEQLEQHISGKEISLDITKFIHHVNNADVDEYYGQSELREAYRAWWSKDTTLLLQNIFLERVAGGFAWIKPVGEKTLSVNSTDYTNLVNVMSSIKSNSSMILPSGFDFNLEHPSDTQAFGRAVQGHDKSIAKSLLMPNLLGLSEQGPNGSRALGDTQVEAFLWVLDSEAGGLEETVNEQLFTDIAEQNFPDGLYPRWKLHDLSKKQQFEIVSKWSELVNNNSVKSRPSDEDHLRSILEFPKVDPKDEENNSNDVSPQTALSGVQVGAMADIVERVATEKIPRETGVQILVVSFPVDLETAEEIMGDVGKGFEPKAPVQVPSTPGTPIPGEEDDDNDDVDPNEDPDKPDETIIGKSGQRIVSKLEAANNRVAFAVIDKNSQQIEEDTVPELSSIVIGIVKPTTDHILTMKVIKPGDLEKIKLDTESVKKLRSAVRRMLNKAWALGEKHARREIDRAKGVKMSSGFVRLDEDAAEFFDQKSFTMTGKITNDMKAIVENILSQSIKSSQTIRDTVDNIYVAFASEGFITGEDAQTEMAGLLETKTAATTAARLNTIVRTNSFEAINEARYSFFTDPLLDDFVEAMEYSAILDGRTTQICQHLDNQIHAADGEVWDGPWRPPNHFNCRSLLIPVTSFDKWSESPFPTINPQAGFGG